MNIYGLVCTRSFAEGLPSAAVVPMADNLNHIEEYTTYELINVKEHFKSTDNS